jgi:hypothetical protein
VQQSEVGEFFRGNRWVSSAEMANPCGENGSENAKRLISLEVSAEGHELIRDQGIKTFSEQALSRLPASGLRDCGWEIRPNYQRTREIPVSDGEYKLPRVLSFIEDLSQYRLLLDIPVDMAWFRGHFPDNPILPGIVQLHWAVGMSRCLFHYQQLPGEVKRLKFKNIVKPPGILELALGKNGGHEIQFQFASLGQIHSLGCLVFEEQETCSTLSHII